MKRPHSSFTPEALRREHDQGDAVVSHLPEEVVATLGLSRLPVAEHELDLS